MRVQTYLFYFCNHQSYISGQRSKWKGHLGIAFASSGIRTRRQFLQKLQVIQNWLKKGYFILMSHSYMGRGVNNLSSQGRTRTAGWSKNIQIYRDIICKLQFDRNQKEASLNPTLFLRFSTDYTGVERNNENGKKRFFYLVRQGPYNVFCRYFCLSPSSRTSPSCPGSPTRRSSCDH